VLQIETNENITDNDQAFAAGFLEGHLTRDLISLHILNTAEGFCNDQSEICVKLFAFLKENIQWMVDQINAHADDPYWHQVNSHFPFSPFN
jgi:Phospholipase B